MNEFDAGTGRERSWSNGLGRALRALTAACLLLTLTPGQAAGYIDPISGSIILQVLAAAALGALLTVRRVWAGLTDACGRIWNGITRRWRR